MRSLHARIGLLSATIAAAACSSVGERSRDPAPLAGPVDTRLAALAPEELWAMRPDAAAVVAAADSFASRAERAQAAGAAVTALASAARARAWLVEHESDAEARLRHAEQAIAAGERCVELAPDEPRCEYWLAVGLGLRARERPTAAIRTVGRIIELLERVAGSMPRLESGGPHRVLALLLLRAPGWPIGPGDPERALEQARLAVRIDPEYPPNLLASAEAERRAGAEDAAREQLERALAAARALARAGNPDAAEWISDAERALAGENPR